MQLLPVLHFKLLPIELVSVRDLLEVDELVGPPEEMLAKYWSMWVLCVAHEMVWISSCYQGIEKGKTTASFLSAIVTSTFLPPSARYISTEDQFAHNDTKYDHE